MTCRVAGHRAAWRGSLYGIVRGASVVCGLLAVAAGALGLLDGFGAAQAQAPGLPPVPVPPENPITEDKRVLGKILFWEERLATDNAVACGTCHVMGRSGTDPRRAAHPGPDGQFGTPDDIFGSPGIARRDEERRPVVDPVFGTNRQITARSAPAAIEAAYAPELFWDGRAGRTFVDPETGQTRIVNGGSLENQALGPLLSPVEMAHEGRGWADVAAWLRRVEPLGSATRLPLDVTNAIVARPSYPELFAAAFGDPAINAERIAFAIATYERTLIPNQTPWDRFVAGDPNALTPGQQRGWNFFRNSACSACHAPPQFTNNTFRAIGLRPPGEDLGRQEVTGNPGDRGRFKVPTLRGVGRKTSFMHNGRLATLQDVIAFYRPNNPDRFPDNVDPLLPVPVPPQEQPPLIDFLSNGLTDPRVAGETFPFDRPNLHNGAMQALFAAPDKTTFNWPPLVGIPSYVVYRGEVADLVDANRDGMPDGGTGDCLPDPAPADTTFVDQDRPAPGRAFFYVKGVRDGGAIRGLGTTSDGKARVPRVPCS